MELTDNKRTTKLHARRCSERLAGNNHQKSVCTTVHTTYETRRLMPRPPAFVVVRQRIVFSVRAFSNAPSPSWTMCYRPLSISKGSCSIDVVSRIETRWRKHECYEPCFATCCLRPCSTSSKNVFWSLRTMPRESNDLDYFKRV